jgi:hypothetical protein
MTNGLIISRNRKNELYKAALNSREQIDKVKYTLYRNMYNTLVKQSKKMHYNESLQANKNNPKKTWDILKEATNQIKKSNNIGNININNEEIKDPKRIANEFNNFFTKIGVEISQAVKQTIKSADEYIDYGNIPDMHLGTVNQAHICDIIKSLKPKGSLDIDGISTNLLKAIKIEISGPLTHIIKMSLETGVFPDKLKISRTVPVFKAGDPKCCDNYRPIALLSAISKILEKIVSVQLVNHLQDNNIIYDHQYGFQRHKSTEHNIIHAINFISTAFNENKYALGVFFDLKKAFDVCSHEILLMKLEKMGIRGTALLWFRNYLRNRKQKVDINGTLSDGIEISILQGSILGPILFLCYINDLHTVTNLLTLMFADDTFCLKSDASLHNLINDTNREINKMALWFRANKLAVNKSKTKYIIFHMRGKTINNDTPQVIYNENDANENDDAQITILERYHNKHENEECRAYKLLGIYLDENLTLDKHVKHITNKLSRSLYSINRAKNILNQASMRALYFALIHSHLTYCPVILGCTSKSNINKIHKIQKKPCGLCQKANTMPIQRQYASNIIYSPLIKS